MTSATRTTPMTRRARRLAVVGLVLLLAAACATGAGRPDPLVLTGEALQAVGRTFLETAQLYDGLYRGKKITEAQYDAWRAFVPKFQQAHGVAFTTWKTAVATQDRPAAARAQALVDTLRLQVLELALGVTVAPARVP